MRISSPLMPAPLQPQSRVKFGEEYAGKSIGGVGWGNESTSVINWQSPRNGDIIPLMVGLRPAQEALLKQVADNTAALNTSMQALATAIQSRFGPM